MNTTPLYSDLKVIVTGLSGHLISLNNSSLFLMAFSCYYLLKEPVFDFEVQGPRSVQTFYANHYLREALDLSSLPNKKILYEYIKSDQLKCDFNNICAKLNFIGIKSGLQIKIKPNSSLNHLFLELISFCNKYYIESLNTFHVSPHITADKHIFKKLEEDGYYVFKDFFSEDFFKDLRKATLDLTEIEDKTKGYYYGQDDKNQRVYNLISKNQIFIDFIGCPFIHSLCNKYFDRQTFHDKYGMNSFSANIIHSGGSKGAWHIDSVLPDPIPVEYPIRLQIIISIDEFLINNGATAVVPKSHKLGRRPNSMDAERVGEGKIICCPPGSLLIFNSSIWHRNTENSTNFSRHSLLASFAASYFMEVCGEEEHLSIIPNEIKKQLPNRIKQMIGLGRAIKKGALVS